MELNMGVIDATFTRPKMAQFERIMGGNDADLYEFPYQAQLKYNDEYYCGATVINSMLVLTAAHCIMHKRAVKMKVITGDYRHKMDDRTEQIRNVSRILYHDKYNDASNEHDIALLLLTQPLEFNLAVRNITLAPKNYVSRGNATATGWGRRQAGGELPITLQEVTMPIVPRSECQVHYLRALIRIFPTMLCAGEMGKDTCQGDSGGPLVCYHPVTNSRYLCGVTSFGNGCGKKNYPGIYTNVALYHDWIDETLRNVKLKEKCRVSYYYCSKKNVCIPRNFLCDGDNDCGDGYDETKCLSQPTCPSEEFRCDNGRCVKSHWRCDGDDDCGDRSDEDKCPSLSNTCESAEFRCNTGRCIDKEWKCDNHTDCDSGEDEMNCRTGREDNTPASSASTHLVSSSSHCGPNEFACSNRRCINISWRCDLEDDCGDNSDETNCPEELSTCLPGKFRCDNGRCISSNWVCDGDQDCADNSDEKNCPAKLTKTCRPDEFLCANNKCINSRWLCDSDDDCGDNSDETTANCTKISNCPSDMFQCERDGKCIPADWRCDMENDCGDNSDEIDCKREACASFQFSCDNGKCVNFLFVCDTEDDCGDNSDENDCMH